MSGHQTTIVQRYTNGGSHTDVAGRQSQSTLSGRSDQSDQWRPRYHVRRDLSRVGRRRQAVVLPGQIRTLPLVAALHSIPGEDALRYERISLQGNMFNEQDHII